VVERITGTMRSVDGRWRVDAIRERSRHWYRVYRDGEVYADQLLIRELLRVLGDAGVQPADLVENNGSGRAP
jgi:hypothetical protein